MPQLQPVHASTSAGYAGDISAQEAWQMLATLPDAQLVDVRSEAEWVFVGLPGLESLGKQVHTIAYRTFPGMEANPRFLEHLQAQLPNRAASVLFLCKTGGRSAEAAQLATQLGYTQAFNVAGGFEGEANEQRQRGCINGWKAEGLPWTQR